MLPVTRNQVNSVADGLACFFSKNDKKLSDTNAATKDAEFRMAQKALEKLDLEKAEKVLSTENFEKLALILEIVRK